MDPDTEIQYEYPPYIRLYKSGRIERLHVTATVPAGLDRTTGVISKDVTIDANVGVSARLYLPDPSPNRIKKLPILVYYHGGGFCIESPFSPMYHGFLNPVCSKANILVVSVNYRLAPEHLLPSAYDDSWAALKWALSPGADPWLAEHGDFGRVFIAGDSAGANIAHQMTMRAGVLENETVSIEGMALFHPFFWGKEAIGSEMRVAAIRARVEAVWKIANPSGVDVDDVRINVTGNDAPSLAGLACKRVMVVVAEKDVLAERGRAYYGALKSSGWGGVSEIFESKGAEHVSHLKKPECGQAAEVMEWFVAFFK